MTPHFARSEFACHDGTPYPEEWLTERLLPLCETLEAIRSRVHRPIAILSGYRTPEYNRKVGGARASQHMQGRAADIRCEGLTAAFLVEFIAGMRGELPHLGGLGAYPNFVHVDVRPGRLVRWRGSRLDT